MLRNKLDIQLRNVCLIFRVYGWLQSLWTPWTPFAPPLEPLEYTAESRDRTGSQHDIQCSEPAAVARGQKCGAGVKSLRTAGYAYCPEICSLAIRLWGRRPEPEALNKRNRATPYVAAAGHSPSSAMGQTAVPPTPLHRTSVSPRALLNNAQLPETRFCRKSPPQERIPVPQAAPRKAS